MKQNLMIQHQKAAMKLLKTTNILDIVSQPGVSAV